MPVRTRSGSSPIRGSYARDGVEVLITSPSRRSTEGRLRSGSLGGVEAVKQRARRDTVTSSDMSSENELDPAMLRRRHINPVKAAKASNLLTQKHEEDERQYLRTLNNTIDEDSAEDSARSSLSSEFGETADSESLLDDIVASSLSDLPSALKLGSEPLVKPKVGLESTLQALPPPRPISRLPPISLLTLALRAQQSGPKNPVESFARLSGKGVQDPLYIRIFAPFSKTPEKAIDMPLLRAVLDNESGEQPKVTVAEAIGLSLYRYGEEEIQPPIEPKRLNVNRWTLRMIEDGEVDYDFPALNRVGPMTDFTSNNNRGVRGRSREKPYDEFALVEATDAEFEQNRKLTPKYEKLSASSSTATKDGPSEPNTPRPFPTTSTKNAEAPSPSATRKTAPVIPVDRQTLPSVQSTPLMGPAKMLKIHFTSLEAVTQSMTVEVTTDTYLAEVLDNVCKRWNLDKSYHMLKVTGTNTVAPVDRTVEALGVRTELDLARRRFANDGAVGLAGSPGSSSPNAPLLLDGDAPRKAKRGYGLGGGGGGLGGSSLHPLAQKQDLLSGATRFRRYNVTRRNPMSFAPSNPRVLLIDEEYMHILPGETGRALFDSNGKTSRVPFEMIVGSKVSRRHPKTFRVIIWREKDQKRYDFEAQSASDAEDIVAEIRKGMESRKDMNPYGLEDEGTT